MVRATCEEELKDKKCKRHVDVGIELSNCPVVYDKQYALAR